MVTQERLPTEKVITVGATSTEVSAEVPEASRRIVMVYTNVSTGGQVISLGIGREAVAGTGIVLYPTGAWMESIDSVFKPTRQRITAIASAAGGALSIHERVE